MRWLNARRFARSEGGPIGTENLCLAQCRIILGLTILLWGKTAGSGSVFG